MATAPCPHCQRPLPPPQGHAQHLSRCLYCGGAWARPEAVQRCFGRELPARASAPSTRPCPDCRVPLAVVRLGPVELDTCPTCRGAFFDRGEIEKVQQLFQASRGQAAGSAVGAVPPRFAGGPSRKVAVAGAVGAVVAGGAAVVAATLAGGTAVQPGEDTPQGWSGARELDLEASSPASLGEHSGAQTDQAEWATSGSREVDLESGEATPGSTTTAGGNGSREVEFEAPAGDDAPLELADVPRRRSVRTNAVLGASVQAAAAAMAASAVTTPQRGLMDMVGSVAGGALDVVGGVAGGAVEVMSNSDASDVVSGLFSVLGFVAEIFD